MKYLFLALFLAGCTPDKPVSYQVFGNGYEMKCSGFNEQDCGGHLYNCEDGQEYFCMHNIIKTK